ncbi:MAG: PQ-loop domain-containing transporter [Thermoplasmatota archaeon]
MFPTGLDWLIFTGSLLFTVALLPQAVRTVRLGRADDFSIPFVLMVIAASAITLTYWLLTRATDWEVYYGFIANLLVWGLVFYYRLWPRPTA